MLSKTTRDRSAALLAGLYGIATICALSLWAFRRWDTHRSSWPEVFFGILNVPVSHSLISVSALGLITAALVARKRFGLYAAAAFQFLGGYVSAIPHIIGSTTNPAPAWATRASDSAGVDIASVIIAVLALAWMWWLRSAYPARLRPGSWLAAVLVAAGGVGVTVAVTWFLVWLSVPGPGYFHNRMVGAAIGRSLGDSDLINNGSLAAVPAWIPQVTSFTMSLTLLAAVWVFMRSAHHETAWSPAREVAIRRLISRADRPDSLDYFATRRDKSSIFSSRGGAVVAYRVLNGVSLASGDPIGDTHQWHDVIARWKQEARTYGWIPAVLGASEEGARAYAAAGLRPLSIGDEAILHPDAFALDSPEMTSVRHAVRRARRRGVVVTIRRQNEIGEEEMAELADAAERWRGNEPDRGFSMALNRHGDPADDNLMVATARDGEGILQAVLVLVPWGRAGRSLDLMRRSPDAPNGTVELIVTELLQRSAELGIRELSLNFCMFRSVYADADRLGAGALTRFNYSILGRLDALWQLERLYVSNQKYQPEWRPRYLCYDGPVSVPLVALAAGTAEGFVPRPFARDLPPADLSPEQLAEIHQLNELPPPPRLRRNDQERVRLGHVEELRGEGIDPWPASEPVAETAGESSLAGRVRRVRDHGGVVFADISSECGAEGAISQVLLEEKLGCAHRTFARLVDIGDLVRFTGKAGVSRTGETSLVVERWEMLAKSLHPMPQPAHRAAESADGWNGAALDRVTLLRHRSNVIRAVRNLLHEQGYLEVETPILHAVHGGATARPFKTRSTAYGTDLSLRIAPELYLKRLLVAGMGPVFELGRNFRNEGVDASHNPEFTSLEVYLPGGDYLQMRLLAEQIVRVAARAVHGSDVLPLPDADGVLHLTDVSAEWRFEPMLDALEKALGMPLSLDMDYDVALALAREKGVLARPGAGIGDLLEELYGKLVESATMTPVFYADFPQETSPLTRPHRMSPGLVERWDLVAAGMEIGTAYTELTDPIDQRDRLTQQSMRAAAGDVEAMEVDEAFLHDLELGMPPTGGLGIGIDRLVMLVTGTPIRSVLSFPFTKPSTRRTH